MKIGRPSTGDPTELRLHPIETVRGYPRLVDGGSELFEQAMERAIGRSKSYGVTVEARDGAAVARIK